MNRIAVVTLGLSSLLASGIASAGTIELWMSSSGKPPAYSSYTSGSMIDPPGSNNKYWQANVSDPDFPEYGIFQIRAYGYTTTNDNGSGAFLQRNVERYSGGLGVCENSSCSDPQHAVDNDGRNDFILIDFGLGHSYSPTMFSIGWEYYGGCTTTTVSSSCPDIEAWVGDSFDAALGWAGITDSWTQILDGDPENNIQPNKDYAFAPGAGRYLLIAAQTGSEVCTQTGYDKKKKQPIITCEYDYFKLQTIAINRNPPEENPPEEVPEPGALALLGLSAVLATSIGRRRRIR
ncbi:MAG: PEP-CTERM sorting domain-containing protein [Burkholderiales bacterium]|nr:PEP-CTERM sorting domain-containing protein [Burkholderiales bacterium]